MIPPENVSDALEYNSIPEWDSVAHMAMVTELEDASGLMLDANEIVAMSSVAKIREILKGHGADI
jgi:acyl carrier protein